MRLFGNMNNETIKAKINKCIQEEKLFENLKSRFCSTSRTICQSFGFKTLQTPILLSQRANIRQKTKPFYLCFNHLLLLQSKSLY